MTVGSGSLVSEHDCLLLDLDGTVYRGAEPVDGAVAALTALGVQSLFVTNNASRGPGEVAARMRRMGFSLRDDDVVTSAQSAARLLASRLRRGARVLVVGADALRAEVSDVGLCPVRAVADDPVAVVQGHSTRTGWDDLAEAALAIRGGAWWLATNLDSSFPTERGLLPGNGSMVAALRTATGGIPDVAGKPQPMILRDALARGQFHSPLVVGDRLDTDIACANAAGLPSLLVCSGVAAPGDVLAATVGQRPTHVALDIRSLRYPSVSTRIGRQLYWRVEADGDAVTVLSTGVADDGDGLSIIRAIAHEFWRIDTGAGRGTPAIRAGDDHARRALAAVEVVERPRRDHTAV
jgi:glycerol 3-phosphatase-2